MWYIVIKICKSDFDKRLIPRWHLICILRNNGRRMYFNKQLLKLSSSLHNLRSVKKNGKFNKRPDKGEVEYIFYMCYNDIIRVGIWLAWLKPKPFNVSRLRHSGSKKFLSESWTDKNFFERTETESLINGLLDF